MSCRKIHANIADLILEPASVPAAVREHVAGCLDCAKELARIEATMMVLDEWRAPEPGPFFDAKLFARLREEESATPMGVVERFRAWLLYSSRLQARQWAAGALAAVLAIGGGTLVMLNHNQASAVQLSATVRDLQSYDGNQQLFQQMNALDSDDDSSAGALH
jgi:hypothetical protein